MLRTNTNWVSSGSRLAKYGAPAAVGVLLFANGIPRVQRDILQVRKRFLKKIC
jgi:hypothetical protein